MTIQEEALYCVLSCVYRTHPDKEKALAEIEVMLGKMTGRGCDDGDLRGLLLRQEINYAARRMHLDSLLD